MSRAPLATTNIVLFTNIETTNVNSIFKANLLNHVITSTDCHRATGSSTAHNPRALSNRSNVDFPAPMLPSKARTRRMPPAVLVLAIGGRLGGTGEVPLCKEFTLGTKTSKRKANAAPTPSSRAKEIMFPLTERQNWR